MSIENSQRSQGSEDSFGFWLASARAGSKEALGHILGPMRSGMKGEAARGMGRVLQSREDASDVVNTAYVKVVKDFPSFSGEERWQFCAWVRKIVANTLSHMGRYHGSQGRDVRKEEAVGSRIEELVPAARGPSPSSMLSMKEWKDEVQRAIFRLSENHQKVIRLRYEAQLELREVAQRMDLSVDATKQLWARAIRALASELRRPAAS